MQEKNRSDMQFLVSQSETSKLQSELFEIKNQHKKDVEQHQKEINNLITRNNVEKQDLIKVNNGKNYLLQFQHIIPFFCSSARC